MNTHRGGAAAPTESGKVDNPRSAGNRAKARLTRTQLEARNEMGRTPEQHRAILEGYLSSFWQYAKRLLYGTKSFTEHEESLSLNAIRKGVYKDYQPRLTEKEWDNYQTELYRRIELAASYYEKHKDKWVPAPYAEQTIGRGYFDEENVRGFAGTLSWFEENKRRYKKNYVQQRINLAVRHLQQHRHNKAPQVLQLKTYIEAFRFLEHGLARYGPEAQDQFRNLVATLGDRKPNLTPGFTKNFKK